MKKRYQKPGMTATQILQQHHLLSGSGGNRSFSSIESDEGFNYVGGGDEDAR